MNLYTLVVFLGVTALVVVLTVVSVVIIGRASDGLRMRTARRALARRRILTDRRNDARNERRGQTRRS